MTDFKFLNSLTEKKKYRKQNILNFFSLNNDSAVENNEI